jgi:hypothetical protein
MHFFARARADRMQTAHLGFPVQTVEKVLQTASQLLKHSPGKEEEEVQVSADIG